MAYEISCRDAGNDCDFMVRSEDRDEVVEMIREHAREQHGMDLSRNDARDMVKQS